MSKYLSMDCVASFLEENVQPLKNIPGASRKNVYVCPWMLDFSETSKYHGLGRFPSTLQFRSHFPSVVNSGYQSEKEALEIKFTKASSQVTTVEPFTVGYVDGQNKGLIVQSIFGLLDFAEQALVVGFIGWTWPTHVTTVSIKCFYQCFWLLVADKGEPKHPVNMGGHLREFLKNIFKLMPMHAGWLPAWSTSVPTIAGSTHQSTTSMNPWVPIICRNILSQSHPLSLSRGTGKHKWGRVTIFVCARDSQNIIDLFFLWGRFLHLSYSYLQSFLLPRSCQQNCWESKAVGPWHGFAFQGGSKGQAAQQPELVSEGYAQLCDWWVQQGGCNEGGGFFAAKPLGTLLLMASR